MVAAPARPRMPRAPHNSGLLDAHVAMHSPSAAGKKPCLQSFSSGVAPSIFSPKKQDRASLSALGAVRRRCSMLGRLWRGVFGSGTEQPSARCLVLPPHGAHDAVPSLDEGSIFFVGNATVIIRYGGFALMTDPNFLHKGAWPRRRRRSSLTARPVASASDAARVSSAPANTESHPFRAGEHAHLGYGLHTVRETNPVIELEDVGHVDFVLLSHMHEDHFDRIVEERLDKSIPIVTTAQAARRLASKGFTSTHALATWQSICITRTGSSSAIRVTAMPARHAPGLLHHFGALPETMGSMLEFGLLENGPEEREGNRECAAPADLPDHARGALGSAGVHVPMHPVFHLYISGDTLVHDELCEIPRRFPDVDVALLHLGGTRVLGLVVTMDAAQGVECVRIINAHRNIPIHFKDYDAFKSRLDEFRAAARAANIQDRIYYIEYGDTYRFVVPPARLQAAAGPSPARRIST
eukprot:Opistho-1_new@108151